MIKIFSDDYDSLGLNELRKAYVDRLPRMKAAGFEKDCSEDTSLRLGFFNLKETLRAWDVLEKVYNLENLAKQAS